jgi:hypothetical protein
VQKIVVSWRRNSDTPYLYTGETGDDARAILTQVAIKSATDVTAGVIAGAFYDYIAAINAGQLSAKIITAKAENLANEIYEDANMAAELDRFALISGYEWGVDNRQQFYFRPRGAAGQTWNVFVDNLSVTEDLGDVQNSAYGVYTDASGRRNLRTDTAVNQDSINRYGMTRRKALSTRTTSEAQSEKERDAFLEDAKRYAVRADVTFARITDAAGTQQPLYKINAGDTLRLQNLPPALSPDLDYLREFLVDFVEYDVERNIIVVEPDIPESTLVTMLARRGAL